MTAGSESGKLMTPCGRVTLRPPVPGAKKAYWNLEWYENDERRQTSGGRTQATAEDKARKVLRNLELDAQPESHERLEVAIAGYLRHLDATASITHTNNTRGELRRALGNIDTKRCESLTKADLRKSLNTARTKDAARVRRTALRGLIGWGLKQGYFSAEQHSAVRDIEWTPPLDAPKRPSRREGARQSNESERFVLASEIPSLDAIAGLAHGFDLRLPETGELLVQFDCSSGLRLGELFAVTADDIDLDRRWVTVERQILSESGLEDRRALPKGGKIRMTDFPDVSTTGYDLLGGMERRLEAVELEHSAGRNPHRLLFPAPKGGYWWAGNFDNKVFGDAARTAGWPQQVWTEEVDGAQVRRQQWIHTMHSLRHRFARDRIDVFHHTVAQLRAVGGWENNDIVWGRYYGQSGDELEAGSEKLRRFAPQLGAFSVN